METIGKILKNKDLSAMVAKSQYLLSLSQLVNQALDPQLRHQCQLLNYDNAEMTLATNNAAWATRIRYMAPQLLKTLRVHPEFKQLKKIKVVARPTVTTTTYSTRQKPSLSTTAQQSLAALKEITKNN